MIGDVMRGKVEVPVWVFGLLLTILLALFAFNATFASTKQQVKINTERLDVLEKNKVSKDEMNLILQTINRIEDNTNRIENKLDQHITLGK